MSTRKSFDKIFFKKWSRDMAYILGFLFADGNIIRTKRNTHFVSFYTADYHLLFSMRRRMNSDHKISERKSLTGSVYVVQIGSRELFDDLIVLGLTPNKARRMRLPKIPKEYTGDFIRGYFDGDGCIWKGSTNRHRRNQSDSLLLSFTSASNAFLSDLFELLKSKGVLGGSLYKSKKGNFSRLSFSTLDSLKIYGIMYNESCELFLPRKKLIFERFIEMRA